MKKLLSAMSVLLLGCCSAVAPVTAGPDVELLFGQTMFETDARPVEAYTLKLGWDDVPLYVWGSTEEVQPELLGQNLGVANNVSYGFGFREEYGNWTAFIEVGMVNMDFEAYDNVVGEMVETELRQRHDYDGREIPWSTEPHKGLNWWWKEPLGLEPDGYATWEFDNYYVGKLGLSYNWNHIIISGAYRYGVGEETLWGWSNWERGSERPTIGDPVSDQCGCAWMESRNRDWSAFELSVGVKW